jgi:phage tail-like protein
MGNVQSASVIYQPANRFRVRIDGQNVGEFEDAEGFDDVEIGVMEINTGDNAVVASQSAGKPKYPVCKLTKGAVKAAQDYLRQWVKQIVTSGNGNGDVDPAYKKIVSLDQLDRSGNPVTTFTLYEAWPSKYSGGKFDAKSNEYRRVSCDLTYRYPGDPVDS